MLQILHKIRGEERNWTYFCSVSVSNSGGALACYCLKPAMKKPGKAITGNVGMCNTFCFNFQCLFSAFITKRPAVDCTMPPKFAPTTPATETTTTF
ncbi:hypothetical protein BVRB_2g024190 [Beta vulgaris subsp. vulgaris]|nr:hypothetical protein BVRB_2g024190 [Beta vulgaris subsp. vulgaris]